MIAQCVGHITPVPAEEGFSILSVFKAIAMNGFMYPSTASGMTMP
jgi:hypothetical protein